MVVTTWIHFSPVSLSCSDSGQEQEEEEDGDSSDFGSIKLSRRMSRMSLSDDPSPQEDVSRHDGQRDVMKMSTSTTTLGQSGASHGTPLSSTSSPNARVDNSTEGSAKKAFKFAVMPYPKSREGTPHLPQSSDRSSEGSPRLSQSSGASVGHSSSPLNGLEKMPAARSTIEDIKMGLLFEAMVSDSEKNCVVVVVTWIISPHEFVVRALLLLFVG